MRGRSDQLSRTVEGENNRFEWSQVLRIGNRRRALVSVPISARRAVRVISPQPKWREFDRLEERIRTCVGREGDLLPRRQANGRGLKWEAVFNWQMKIFAVCDDDTGPIERATEVGFSFDGKQIRGRNLISTYKWKEVFIKTIFT